MGTKITINDIARLAGVSKATVSRVLNNKVNVEPETRERVMRVINEHRFVPNVTASDLAGGRNRFIGVLAPPLTWPAVPIIMEGIARALELTSYEIVLYSISPKRNHQDVLDDILAMNLTAGLISIIPGQLSSSLQQLHRDGHQIVVIDDQGAKLDIPWVGIDNRTSAYQATQYLLQHGHTRIAHILGIAGYRFTQERYDGYCDALREANIFIDETLCYQGDLEIPGGQQCAHQIFSQPRDSWPTAIFVGSDLMAYGVMTVAEEYGIRIPEDISIIGFDDIPLCTHMKPPLTTIRQPYSEMGEAAAHVLLSMIDPDFHHNSDTIHDLVVAATSVNAPTPIRIELPSRLIVRESCGISPFSQISSTKK